MKIPTPVALAIIVLALGIVGIAGYQQYQAGLSGSVEVIDEKAYPPFHTEERWSVTQISQFIADLGALARAGETGAMDVQIGATRDGASEYKLKKGGDKETISLSGGVWNPMTYAAWAKKVLGKAAQPGMAEMRPTIARRVPAIGVMVPR